VFCRGVDPDQGPDFGIYADLPHPKLIDTHRQMLVPDLVEVLYLLSSIWNFYPGCSARHVFCCSIWFCSRLPNIGKFMPDAVYRQRNPQNSPYYQCVEDHLETFEQVYEDRFERQYGFFRPYVKQVIYRKKEF